MDAASHAWRPMETTMTRRRALGTGAFGIAPLLTVASWAQSQQAQAPVREITKIAGEVYRFRNAGHYSVFAVTPAGVIATDPINADAARWLKGEIALYVGATMNPSPPRSEERRVGKECRSRW